MTIQVPISHHFTPVFYQKYWAGDGGRVVRYHRPYDVVVTSRRAPKSTGFEDNLYSYEGVPPEFQAILETEFFSPVDNNAALVLEKLLGGQVSRLTNNERVHFGRLLLSVQLRSPFAMAELKRLADKIVRENLEKDDAEYNAARKAGEPGNIYDWTAKYQRHVIANAHKQFLPGLIDHEGLGQYLINMRWTTIDVAESAHTLLTGDRPFISTHGWKDPRATLLFPLSPTVLFAATNTAEQMAHIGRIPKTRLVSHVNNDVARCAVDFVIGSDKSHLLFVERRLRKRDQEPMPGPIGKGRPNCPS